VVIDLLLSWKILNELLFMGLSKSELINS
jgi:hypothetical protein